jgi:hypothetical protein
LAEAIEVFREARAVVVFTHDRYDHRCTFQLNATQRQTFERAGAVIHLSRLSPGQVQLLADERWSGPRPCPFDRGGLEAALGQSRYTVGDALMYLESMLRRRLIGYELGDTWPGPPEPPGLRLDRDFLVREMREMRWITDRMNR